MQAQCSNRDGLGMMVGWHLAEALQRAFKPPGWQPALCLSCIQAVVEHQRHADVVSVDAWITPPPFHHVCEGDGCECIHATCHVGEVA